jgi:hypothetical protein
MMRMLWEEQYPPCLLWSWVGSKGIKGTVLRERLPENDAHVVGGAVSALSAVELGGDLIEAIKGTDLRECSPKNDAHVVGGAVSAQSVAELGGKQEH